MAKHPFVLAPERMSVKTPEGSVPLGNPIHLVLTFAPGKLVGTIDSAQRDASGPILDSFGPVKVVSDQGSTKTIEIVPMQVGPLDVQIITDYLDDAHVEQTVHLNVVPSAKGLKEFSLGLGSGIRMRLDGTKYDRDKRLSPIVTYEGITTPIYLIDCSQIKLSIEQDEGDPVISSVDNLCRFHALHEGKAILTGDFDGVKDQIDITVFSSTNLHPK
jgi:hypothetical protein